MIQSRDGPERYDPLKPHHASLAEHGRAFVARMLAENDAESTVAEQPGKPPLAVAEGQRAEILAGDRLGCN